MSLRIIGSVIIGLSVIASPVNSQASSAPPAHDHADHHDHDHASEGPNHGDLIELGKKEFFAEFVLNEKEDRVIIFLLDHEAKNYVPIDAPTIAINLKLQGKPMQFKLRADPQKGESSTASSRFTMKSHELVDALHDEHSEAKLSLKIGKKAFVSKVHLDHDHDEHGHTGHTHAEKPTKGPRR